MSMFVSVCLSVCLSVCPQAYLPGMDVGLHSTQPNTTHHMWWKMRPNPTHGWTQPMSVSDISEIYQFFCACYQWSWLGPPLMELRYVMYFRFYGRRHVCTQWPGIVDEKNAYTQSDSTRGNRFDNAANT